MKSKIILLSISIYIFYQYGVTETSSLPSLNQSNSNQKHLHGISSTSSVGENIQVHNSSDFQIETVIAINPSEPKIMLGAAITGANNHYGFTTGAYATTDGGETWFGTDTLRNDSGNIITTGGDPWVSISSNGSFLLSYLIPYGTEGKYKVGTSYSADNGLNWSSTSYVPNVYNADKDYIIIDNSSSSPYEGRSYLLFTQDSAGSNIFTSFSTNDGANWSQSKKITIPRVGDRIAASLALKSNGEIYVSWSTRDYSLAKSTNGGNNWTIIGDPVLSIPNNSGTVIFNEFQTLKGSIYGNTFSGRFNSSNNDIDIKDKIYYKILARDNSAAHNIDSSVLYFFTFRNIFLCEEFINSIFPPPNWDTNFVGTNYWSRSVFGSFGHDSSSAKFDFYHASNGTFQSITSSTFTSSESNDVLKFSFAHAPRGTGTDSLYIESSTNNGATYSPIDTLWGNINGGELNTASTTSSEFYPSSSQWSSKQ